MNDNICRVKGTEKRATKNMQLVLRHCYDELNSDIAHQVQPTKSRLFFNRFEREWWNAQHRFSTRFEAMLQNKLHVLVARFTEA